LLKGTQVTVFGSLTLREWVNKEGAKQLSPDVRVDEIELQGGKRDGQQEQPRQAPQRQQQSAASMADLDDDPIPF
jgi:single-strand DNA-binding protein